MNACTATLSPSTRALLRKVWAEFRPPEQLSIAQWAEKYRVLSPEESATPGRFRLSRTPAMRAILDACSDPATRKVAVMKPAQFGYTAAVVANVLGYHIHMRPSVQIVVFPREKSAKDFAAEKLDPAIRATPPLAERVALKSRAAGNSATRKHYPGGLIKLVGSNSPADVKSTSARIVIVEEPDDVASDVRGGQGDAIKLAEERAKSYPDHLVLIGGTPTGKGVSSIEAEILASDQRKYFVPCHVCGEAHTPSWENVVIPEDHAAEPREIYGQHRFEDAHYVCPACKTPWSEAERHAALRQGHFEATAPASATVGFLVNELCSTFPGSAVPILARKYLEAQFKLEEGDASEMVAFWNSTLGLPWEYKGELPPEDELRDRAEPYAQWTVPEGALVPVLSVDVQHDRLAVTCWIFGRREEMWLAYWGELHGPTMVPEAGAWVELDEMLERQTVLHPSGAGLPIHACAIDSSDGQTSAAVYDYVRKRNRPGRPVYAIKGASDSEGKVELWRPAAAIDPRQGAKKASRLGVHVNIIGTARAKDVILGWAQEGGRVRLTGNGPYRMHWYQTVRPDFYEQLLSEIKIPMRINPKRRAWKKRADRRNEALDCTVYAVWLCHALRLNTRRPEAWDDLEVRIRQGGLFDRVEPDPVAELAPSSPPPAPRAPAATEPTPSPSRGDWDDLPTTPFFRDIESWIA